MNRLMRATLLAFVVSLAVWGLIAVWTQIRVYELLRTWQIIAVDVAIVSGLVMLALLVYAAWERLETLVQTCAVPRRLVRRESATRTFAELLIDCEEDRTLRAVLVGMLREGDRLAPSP